LAIQQKPTPEIAPMGVLAHNCKMRATAFLFH
jgi:hypothetical protein